MSVSLEEVQKRMHPGGWFSPALLEKGTSLLNLIEDDKLSLGSINISARVIGERLDELLIRSSGTDWFDGRKIKDLSIEIHHRRGFLSCPWAPDEFEKCSIGNKWRPTADEFIIFNKTTKKSLNGFLLSVHMIKEHDFFGGPGTKYRIEPIFVAKMIGLQMRNHDR
jgi:hypothetical protein